MNDAALIEKAKKHSPLTETSYYILIALVEPLHGYGVITKVDGMTHGRVNSQRAPCTALLRPC